MADAFAQFELLLREFISTSVLDLQLIDDDPAWNLIGTFDPEPVAGKRAYDTVASDFPPGWEARFEIQVQSGGRVAGGNFVGNTLTAMGKDSHLMMGQAADAKYLDPTKTPLDSYIEIHMLLKRIKGSVTINRQQTIADLATKPLEQIAANASESAARRLRSYILNGFYGTGDSTVAQVNDSTPPTITETAGGVAVTIDAGTYGRFMEGDLIVFGTNADPRVLITGAGAGGATGLCRVVSIDSDLRTIKVQSEPGVGNVVTVDNAHILLADTYDFAAASVAAGTLQTEGAESLLISSGTFPGSTSPKFTSGLEVADHTALKSFIADDSAAKVDPSMEQLTLLLDKILDTGRTAPMAFISERGVWTRHAQLQLENNAMFQVPMGATFQASGGVAGPVLSHMENTFQKFNSIRVRENSILGLNPSTWKKFMPLGDRTIHWVYGSGPLAGVQSIFGPVYSGSQLTELQDAPFDSFCEFGCVDPRANFRRLGLNAQRDV